MGGGIEPGPFSFHINTDGLWKDAAKKYKAEADEWRRRAERAEAQVRAADPNAEVRSTFHETARPGRRGPKRPID